MGLLKGAVVNALTVLKDNRDKGIFEWDKYAEVFDRIEDNAKFYREKKLQEYARKLRKENPVPENASKEQREEIEDRINEKLKNWEPNTKMGVKRYKAAIGLANDAKFFAKRLRNGKKERENYREGIEAVKAAGHDVVWKADIRYRQGRPYNGGVWQLLNFCGKNPAYTPEHTVKANKMYDNNTSHAMFLMCRHIKNRRHRRRIFLKHYAQNGMQASHLHILFQECMACYFCLKIKKKVLTNKKSWYKIRNCKDKGVLELKALRRHFCVLDKKEQESGYYGKTKCT
ncbi:MAG: hypothetical protein K5750_06475 [Eubacterium sp.]|nr:hypothetical protein [Eubacterium sp.]